ncbi:MAG TPA: YwqG family protein [Pseudaminobacter sp.]|nr:YwqG family protein [Pseudaminobacter sp.]
MTFWLPSHRERSDVYQSELDKQRESAIWFRRQTGGKNSLSQLGGLPSLPPNIKWPQQHQSGTPLHFLAQIDLSQLPPTPLKGSNTPALPDHGLLLFFADMVEEMLWGENGGPFAATRVISVSQAGPERPIPEDIPAILHAFGERGGGYDTGISLFPRVCLESYKIQTFAGIEPDPYPEHRYSEEALAAMVESIERVGGPIPVLTGEEAWNASDSSTGPYIRELTFADGSVRRELHCPLHQMFGHGKNIQGTAREDGNILLLQIDTDRSVHEHFMFCDMGVAQFWIKPADLAAGKFENAWGTTEGG